MCYVIITLSSGKLQLTVMLLFVFAEFLINLVMVAINKTV